MSRLISTDHLPAGERFEYWREVAGQVRLAPVEVQSDHQTEFRFELRYSDLGAARVSLFTTTPYRVLRTPKLIRRSDPERLSVGMVLQTRGLVDQSGRRAHLPPGTFTLYDNSHPYRIDLAPVGGAGNVRGLIVNFPRSLLPLPSAKVKQLTSVTMPAGPGIGALTSQLLVQLATGMDHYTPAEAARLSSAALEVLATRLAHELDGDRWVAPEMHRRVLLQRIHAFIQHNLGDPDLSPAAIAAAHHVSLRLLQKLFQEQGETVAGWIRTRRLEGSRRDLLDPAQAHRPVTTIGARWGFRSPIQFSRAFSAAYGLPPHEYRLNYGRSGSAPKPGPLSRQKAPPPGQDHDGVAIRRDPRPRTFPTRSGKSAGHGEPLATAVYTYGMADPITFRPTAEDTENLAILTADGTSPTHAIRQALEIAAHKKRQEDLRADAARLAANPEYQAELRAVREELDELRAW